MGVVVRMEDVRGDLEPVSHEGPVHVQRVRGNLRFLLCGDQGLGAGVKTEISGQKALLRQHSDVGAGGKHVGARQQPGVEVHPHQVQQCGQNVGGGAVCLHGDVLFQTGRIENKAVVILLKDGVDRLAGQLVVLLLRQTIGVVIVGQDDAGAVKDARFLKPCHKVFQGVFQF